ncbi:MAG: chromosome segregation protein SMC [Dissulfurispiraceae bacterium]|jgi:chromosome segregation protein|nr:chromosome segregation protein SMC [Dissulfurispiraceae bacterium]
MKIRRIELNGFKSFADKITLPLHTGITCIVGPNGCGKSNVVDAFRWVLGEQSAKSLRGDKMEEVIFQGSHTKKPKGMAEVSLTFTHFSSSQQQAQGNGSGSEGSSEETVVARRLYRSGDSEYILNKRQCRLRDIKDIFLDTGLDVKSYSILDQGRISEIMNAKPLDRRFLIEEVAGVMKYKVRRAEALSKLESSKQNLQRINDIVYEVKRQINSLDRQVKKAERYKRLIAELKEIELRIAKREYTGLSSALAELTSELQQIKENDSSKRSQLSSMENAIETKRLAVAEKEKALSELEDRMHEKEKAIADTEKEIGILKANIENTKNDSVRLAGQGEEIDLKKEELKSSIAEIEAAEASLDNELQDLTLDLDAKKEKTAEIETAINSRQTDITAKTRELFSISEKHSSETNALSRLESAHENLLYRESIAIKDTETITAEIKAAEASISEAGLDLEAKQSEQQQLKADKERIQSEIESISSEIEQKRADISKAREELAADISRLNSLQELVVDRSLMDFLKESQEHQDFAANLLSEMLSADKSCEAAIEAALSTKINSLVVNRAEDLLAAVRLIKEKNLDRTSLFYTGINPLPSESITELNSPDIVGSAAGYITFDKAEAKEIAASLLHNTYIVKDLNSAIEIRKKSGPNPPALVTLDGDLIEKDGTIFSGRGKGILKRKREIKELQESTGRLKTAISNLEGNIASLNSQLEERRTEHRKAELALVEVEKRISLSSHSLENQREELERKSRKLSLLSTEITAIAAEKESALAQLDGKKEMILRIEAEREDMNSIISTLNQELADRKSIFEEVRSQLTELRMSAASLREKTDSLQREKESFLSRISELEHRKLNAETEARNALTRLEQYSSKLTQLEENIKALITEADQLLHQRRSQKEMIDAENLALTDENSSLRILRADIDQISQAASDMNSRAVETRLRLENIVSGIHNKYGIEIGQEDIQIMEFNPEEDLEKAEQLNAKIRDLGPVNLGTLEEYEELRTRYEFLTKQQQDLNMSIAELEEAISRINSTTRQRLRDAFNMLKDKFTEVFTILFGGGKATLMLTDEDNILESGIEIVAQPPGKKLQNINLLSGGEKALTSLALLFAGFLIKPSPLCILDEADAPLDESNTVRFAQMIKSLSGDTQFIVITHNRTTMEVADYLYGITMEEPGASKAISLQFSEVA